VILELETHLTAKQAEFAIAQQAATITAHDTINILFEDEQQVEFELGETAIWILKGQMEIFSVARKGEPFYINRSWEQLTSEEQQAVSLWEE
jgi:hypothetical protein